MDRQNRTVTSGGTITRTVYDVRGLTCSVYVGTDDSRKTKTIENYVNGGPVNSDSNGERPCTKLPYSLVLYYPD